MALLGLTTYRQNNNIKSAILLLLFPLLLLTLLGVTLYGLVLGLERLFVVRDARLQ